MSSILGFITIIPFLGFTHFLAKHTAVFLTSLAVIIHILLYWLYRSQWDQFQSYNGIKFLQVNEMYEWKCILYEWKCILYVNKGYSYHAMGLIPIG
jgi:hypothetical protein